MNSSDSAFRSGVGPIPLQQQQRAPLEAGVTYRVWFPFKRDTYERFEGDGSAETPTWIPGWRYEQCGEYGEDSEAAWDGEGAESRLIVSIHRPGRYPARAFYVRQWQAPDGKIFGKSNLRVTTVGAFRNWLRGSKTAHLFDDRKGALEASRALFHEALALAAEQCGGAAAHAAPSPQVQR